MVQSPTQILISYNPLSGLTWDRWGITMIGRGGEWGGGGGSSLPPPFYDVPILYNIVLGICKRVLE